MEKIISLFQRNYDGDRLVRDELVEGAEWVPAGLGVATRKYDGTCCMVDRGKLYRRHTIKRGRKIPENFIPTTAIDVVTGKQEGWVAVGDGPEDQYHREAFECRSFMDGTYELVGPKIQKNAEGFHAHKLVSHMDAEELHDCPRNFHGIQHWFIGRDIEGVVWHHPDGRMVKIKKKDFGLKR